MGGYESVGGNTVLHQVLIQPQIVLFAWPLGASNLGKVPWQWTPGAEVGGAARPVPAMADVTNWGAAVVAYIL